MNEALHPAHLENARNAILRRFCELNTPPNGIAKLSLFVELMSRYRGGYFAAALDQLADEQCIEAAVTSFLRLTWQGYEAAHALQM